MLKKILLPSVLGIVLTGCASTGSHTNETVVRQSPRVIYVYPHDPWLHHRHWHWGWHHRYGWGWNHPRHYHAPFHHVPNRDLNDQRRTIPTPINPGEANRSIPRDSHLK